VPQSAFVAEIFMRLRGLLSGKCHPLSVRRAVCEGSNILLAPRTVAEPRRYRKSLNYDHEIKGVGMTKDIMMLELDAS
jgi:hypothetical protein